MATTTEVVIRIRLEGFSFDPEWGQDAFLYEIEQTLAQVYWRNNPSVELVEVEEV